MSSAAQAPLTLQSVGVSRNAATARKARTIQPIFCTSRARFSFIHRRYRSGR